MLRLSAAYFVFFFLMIRRPPRSTLFPYTTLFRSPQPSGRVRSQPVLPADDLDSDRAEPATCGQLRGTCRDLHRCRHRVRTTSLVGQVPLVQGFQRLTPLRPALRITEHRPPHRQLATWPHQRCQPRYCGNGVKPMKRCAADGQIKSLFEQLRDGEVTLDNRHVLPGRRLPQPRGQRVAEFHRYHRRDCGDKASGHLAGTRPNLQHPCTVSQPTLASQNLVHPLRVVRTRGLVVIGILIEAAAPPEPNLVIRHSATLFTLCVPARRPSAWRSEVPTSFGAAARSTSHVLSRRTIRRPGDT